MSTITPAQEQAIRDTLASMDNIPRGIRSKDAACSVAAINLALSGELTDRIPECMSEVIGRWIIAVQDRMPAEVRNSAEWRELLPFAAGTGRELEAERLAVIMEWMWAALETLQDLADAGGYGDKWQRMLDERTDAAARAVADAVAHAAARVAARAAASASAYAVAHAVAHAAARAAARAAAYAAASASADAVAYAASAASHAAARAAYAAASAGRTDWPTLDPVGLLRRLIQIGSE